MLDDQKINNLGLIIDDRLNENIDRTIARKRINAILHNKSNSTVLQELCVYIKAQQGNTQNRVVLIVVLTLLCRNLDCDKELSTIIHKYELTNRLYGGLLILLSGKASNFSLKIKWNDNLFKNKYQFLCRFDDFKYRTYIEVFQAVKILYSLNNKKFEELALNDKTKLILLNIVHYNLDIKTSDDLICQLLKSDDELKQNIGLYIITRKVSKTLNDINYINNCQKRGITATKDLKKAMKKLNDEAKKGISLLEKCCCETQASLLFNYLLIHQTIYPVVFAKKLMSNNLQIEFKKQISSSGKIRLLKDICTLIELVKTTPALNEHNKRISKTELYIAITELLQIFIKERKVYLWDNQSIWCFKYICEQLPPKYIRQFKTFLIDERKSLMCEEIDRLLRFKIYLYDHRQAEIIDGILNIIDEQYSK